MTIYIVFSVFTSGAVSILATTEVSVVFLCSIYAFIQYISVVSMNQILMCTI